jgi:hypothetical protein
MRRTPAAAGVLTSAALALGLSIGLGAGTAHAADLDCKDFATQQQAQVVYDAVPGDPNRLDRDGDGIACETLPTGGAEDGTALTPTAQVATVPAAAVAAGDGSTAHSRGVAPYAVGGTALLAAAGAGWVARRSSRASA